MSEVDRESRRSVNSSAPATRFWASTAAGGADKFGAAPPQGDLPLYMAHTSSPASSARLSASIELGWIAEELPLA
jgi:hypothetical protein